MHVCLVVMTSPTSGGLSVPNTRHSVVRHTHATECGAGDFGKGHSMAVFFGFHLHTALCCIVGGIVPEVPDLWVSLLCKGLGLPAA